MFKTIVADPPWKYTDTKAGMIKTGKGAASHYDCLSLAAIADFLHSTPYDDRRFIAGDETRYLDDWIAPNAHLWLWVTNAFLVGGEGPAICRAWGFEPKTALTWVKGRIHENRIVNHIGQGSYLRNSTEHVIFAVRGKCPPAVRNLPTAFIAPRYEHSAKPELVQDWAEKLSPGPYLELFARRQRKNWTCLGDQA